MSNEKRREESFVTYLYTCDFAGRQHLCIIHGRRGTRCTARENGMKLSISIT